MQREVALSSITSRIGAIDIARGVALVAMTIFHFCWDLAMFRLINPEVMTSPAMIWFARSIAGSFLFLVGFSLVLAHSKGINWPGFFYRLALIVGAAALITSVTYFATPEAYIYFGILHSIAVASVLGLAFLNLDWRVTITIALIFLFGRSMLSTPALDAPVWWWTGLSVNFADSNDYVPIFPFFGMVLLGVAGARLASASGTLQKFNRLDGNNAISRLLEFIGRNSLAYYLLHQPVMLAILSGFLWVSGRI